jgi:hypothetical protein
MTDLVPITSFSPSSLVPALVDASGDRARIRPEVTKRLDLTHKRTNHELRRPCERDRVRP